MKTPAAWTDFVSANPTPAVRLALEARGIADHGTALPPRARAAFRRRDVFVMADGSMVDADSRVVADVAREAGVTERAQRRYTAPCGNVSTVGNLPSPNAAELVQS